MTNVVTRIAPSPTGMMHIGTARTALFNYLYAKHMGGEFRLRIEDTDKERSTDEATKVILDGLDWLGLAVDGPVVHQSKNKMRHQRVVFEMLENGSAYICDMTPAETDAWKAENKGKAFRSRCRDGGARFLDSKTFDYFTTPFDINLGAVVRLKVPLREDIVVNDLVKGPITFKTDNLDDIVLLRSDGSPTYNLAVVVDDHDMGVTHVIRGDDHVNNTPRQMLIYRAMGWDVPAFGHIPLIYNEEGKKLSKRDGAASIMDFAAAGYLPEAMRNYLTRLGWGHGDSEIFTDAEAIEWFDITDVLSSPARMNAKRLKFINKHYIQTSLTGRLAMLAFTDHVFDAKDSMAEVHNVYRAINCLKGNASTLVELVSNYDAWVVNRPELDEKAREALNDAASIRAVQLAYACLAPVTASLWTVEHLNNLLHKLAEDHNIHMKVLGSGMRAVLTGRTSAPDLGSCLVAIGQATSMSRLAEMLK